MIKKIKIILINRYFCKMSNMIVGLLFNSCSYILYFVIDIVIVLVVTHFIIFFCFSTINGISITS